MNHFANIVQSVQERFEFIVSKASLFPVDYIPVNTLI